MNFRFCVAACISLGSLNALACNVPVCRYALEHWEPAPYTITLFHSGPLTKDAEAAVGKLKSSAANGDSNITYYDVDVTKPIGDDAKDLWRRHQSQTLPRLVVTYGDSPESFLSGPVTTAFVESLLDSPVRRTIVSSVSKGCGVVFLLLECGEKTKDDAAFDLLSERLKTAQPVANSRFAESMAGEADDADTVPNAPPGGLTFSFTAMRVSQNDAAEEATIKMLRLADRTQSDTSDAPSIYVIFGRGRVMPSFPATPQHEADIAQAAAFMSGPCSCDIRNSLNGADLLLSADWSSVAELDTAAPTAPEKTASTPVIAPGPVKSKPPSAPDSEKLPAASVSLRDLLPVLGIILSLFALAAPARMGLLSRRLNPMLRYSLASAGLVLSLCALLYTGRSSRPEVAEEPLILFCAASLKAPVEAAVASYEREYGRHVAIQFGPSETLLTSLKTGQRGDLFLPADSSFVDKAATLGLSAEVIPIAKMTPVIGVQKGNPRNIRSIDDLLKKGVRTLMASPAAAITQLTDAKLRELGRWRDFENARQSAVINQTGAVTEVANGLKLGSADAGIIFDSMAAQYPELEIIHDPLLDTIVANASVAVLKASTRPSAALHFARYLSAKGAGIEEFRKRGYRVVDADEWEEVPELKLLAGAMLRPAIQETLYEFERREGVKLSYDFEGCGILVAKMKAGDHPDMFIACDASFIPPVQSLFGASTTLSRNDVIIAVQKGNPQGIKSLNDLADKNIRIGLGNERQCALGVLTQKRLEEANLCQAIMKNVTTQLPTGDLLVNLLRTQSLDAVIVYRSNITGLDDVEKVSIDASLVKAQQPLVIGVNSRHKRLAERLKAALLSVESKTRFTSAGFEWKGDIP